MDIAYRRRCHEPCNPRSEWLKSRVSDWIIHCGGNGLDIFGMETVFAFLGFIGLLEAGRSLASSVFVNGLGVGVTIWTALWILERQMMRDAQPSRALAMGLPRIDLSEPIRLRSGL